MLIESVRKKGIFYYQYEICIKKFLERSYEHFSQTVKLRKWLKDERKKHLTACLELIVATYFTIISVKYITLSHNPDPDNRIQIWV